MAAGGTGRNLCSRIETYHHPSVVQTFRSQEICRPMPVLVVLLADFSQCELLGRNSIEKLNRTVWSAALTRARARHMTPWLSFFVGSTVAESSSAVLSIKIAGVRQNPHDQYGEKHECDRRFLNSVQNGIFHGT